MKADALDVLEAAYTVDGTERAWLERLCAVMHAQLEGEDGVVGFPYRIGEDGRLTPGEMVCSSLPTAIGDQIREVLLAMPADYVRDTYARYPSAIATQFGTPASRRATRAMAEAWRTHYGWPWRDFMNINGLDPTGCGLYLGAPLRAEGRMTTQWRTHWNQVATHLAAAGYAGDSPRSKHGPPTPPKRSSRHRARSTTPWERPRRRSPVSRCGTPRS